MSAGRRVPGTPPPDLGELVRAEDRLSFAYFEHCVINRADNAITVTDETGTMHIPTATLSVLMLGPGASVTHQAMTVIGENGATVIWVGERWGAHVRVRQASDPFIHASAATGENGVEYEIKARGGTKNVPDALSR